MIIRNIIIHKNHPHLIVKDIFTIKQSLKKIYDIKPESIDSYKTLSFKKSNIYCEFDCQSITKDVCDYIKLMIQHKSYYNVFYFIFICCNNLKKDIQYGIKKYMDNLLNYKFIFITNQDNYLLPQLKNRCLRILSKKSINTSRLTNHLIDYMFQEFKQTKNIFETCKNISYHLCCLQVSLKDVIYSILEFISKKPEISNKKIKNIVQEFCNIERLYQTSYYKILYYEYCLLYFYQSIYPCISTI